MTPSLTLDDKVLKEVIRDLYYPECPYEFSVVPAEILGQVYEQFLGRVIRITRGHQAVVEEKPEVKKAGGVYYTPAYIVDYIVTHTLGELLRGQQPTDVAKIRVLDPACGSGSFLLGAYQFLLDWYLKWYVANDPRKYKKQLYRSASGAWKLTIDERKRILLTNIYGVDIDRQAVEVTKLSLLLKVLEDETGDTLRRQYELFKERALPDLGANIQCGNSLIGPDFLTNIQMDLLDSEQLTDVNVFDWQRAFPKIFASGGFSVVVGNPPYVNAWTLFESAPHIRDYINGSKLFKSADRHWDLYVLFLEKALDLCRPKGPGGHDHSLLLRDSKICRIVAGASLGAHGDTAHRRPADNQGFRKGACHHYDPGPGKETAWGGTRHTSRRSVGRRNPAPSRNTAGGMWRCAGTVEDSS